MVKTCKKCGITKDINCFTKSKNIKDGYENSCKECRNKARKNKIKICEQCGKKFKASRNSAKYCSIECQGISHRRRTKVLCAFCVTLILTKKSYDIIIGFSFRFSYNLLR